MAQRLEPRRIGFDTEGFMQDLRRVCANQGKTLTEVAQETGINYSTLSYMTTRARVPDGVHLAALCAWSGLDAGHYSRYVEDLI